jgi:hypothetical protein
VNVILSIACLLALIVAGAARYYAGRLTSSAIHETSGIHDPESGMLKVDSLFLRLDLEINRARRVPGSVVQVAAGRFATIDHSLTEALTAELPEHSTLFRAGPTTVVAVTPGLEAGSQIPTVAGWVSHSWPTDGDDAQTLQHRVRAALDGSAP